MFVFLFLLKVLLDLVNISGIPIEAGGQMSVSVVSPPMFRTQFYYKPCPLPGTAPARPRSRIVDVVHPTHPGLKWSCNHIFC